MLASFGVIDDQDTAPTGKPEPAGRVPLRSASAVGQGRNAADQLLVLDKPLRGCFETQDMTRRNAPSDSVDDKKSGPTSGHPFLFPEDPDSGCPGAKFHSSHMVAQL